MKFHGIQLLRLGAALGVVFSHLGSFAVQILQLDNPFLTFLSTHGIFRVTLVVFFAVSGFVMAHALRKTPPGEFLSLRLLRLFPTYWIAANGVLLFKLLVFGHYPADAGSILKGLFLLPDGDRVHHLLGVEWTLVYELYFYLSVALFAWIGGRRGIRLGCGLWLGAVLLRGLLMPNFGTTERPEWYHLPLSGWHLPTLLGLFAYELRERCGSLRTTGKWLAPVLLWGSLQVAPVDELWLLLQSLAGAMLVWWFADWKVSAQNLFVRLGDWTYGIYLLHAQVISLCFAVIHKRGWDGGIEWVVMSVALGLALAIGVGYGWAEVRLYGWLRRLFSAEASIRRPSTAERQGIVASPLGS